MKYLLLLFSSFMCSAALGQPTPKLSVFLNQCIIKGKMDDTDLKTKKNFAHFYAIALSFDSNGKIDTLYYSSKLNPETKKIYVLDHSLLKRIRTYDFKFKEYASKIVLIPFYYYNIKDNSVDYTSGILNSIENLIPEAVLGKNIIILKPVVDANDIAWQN